VSDHQGASGSATNMLRCLTATHLFAAHALCSFIRGPVAWILVWPVRSKCNNRSGAGNKPVETWLPILQREAHHQGRRKVRSSAATPTQPCAGFVLPSQAAPIVIVPRAAACAQELGPAESHTVIGSTGIKASAAISRGLSLFSRGDVPARQTAVGSALRIVPPPPTCDGPRHGAQRARGRCRRGEGRSMGVLRLANAAWLCMKVEGATCRRRLSLLGDRGMSRAHKTEALFRRRVCCLRS